MRLEQLDAAPLIEWAVERETIRKRKEAGVPPPWTTDPILGTYRFTNVRRRDDRVSVWIRDNVCLKYNPDEARSFFLFLALCRWINWPPTIKMLMDAGVWPAPKLNYTTIWQLMDTYAKRGEKVWTGAYMIRAKPGSSQHSKARFVVTEVIEAGLEPVIHGLLAACSGRLRLGVWEILNSRPNWGSFMAGQVVDDLTWTPLLLDPNDNYSWAPMGPGSVRGLNRLRGAPLKERVEPEEWTLALQWLRQRLLDALGSEYVDVTAHDVQNCLCETDKYLRVQNGEGRPRAKYEPETAF
jgi:hypothetical protein